MTQLVEPKTSVTWVDQSTTRPQKLSIQIKIIFTSIYNLVLVSCTSMHKEDLEEEYIDYSIN